MTAVLAQPHEVGEQRAPVGGRELGHDPACLDLADRAGLEQEPGEQVVLVAVDVDQPNRGVRFLGGTCAGGRLVEPEPGRPAVGGLLALLEVLDPAPAAVGPLDPADEARGDRLDRVEDPAAVLARLRQRVRQQVQDQLLVGLPGGVDPDVTEGRGRQQSTQQVERLGPDRAVVGGRRRAVRRRVALAAPGRDPRQQVGVDPEQLVHRRLVAGLERGVAVVAVAALAVGRRDRLVVRDVARRLLEVGADPGTLEDLGEDVRAPLGGDVDPAELGDRVVTEAEEDPVVEVGRSRALAAVPGRRALPRLERFGELVEEQPPDRAGVAAVAGEQRALDRLRQIHEPEDGPRGVRDVRRQASQFGGGQVVNGVLHGQGTVPVGPVGANAAAVGTAAFPARERGHRCRPAPPPRAPHRASRLRRADEDDRLGRGGENSVPPRLPGDGTCTNSQISYRGLSPTPPPRPKRSPGFVSSTPTYGTTHDRP